MNTLKVQQASVLHNFAQTKKQKNKQKDFRKKENGFNIPAMSLELSDFIRTPIKYPGQLQDAIISRLCSVKWQGLHLDLVGPPPAFHYSLSSH